MARNVICLRFFCRMYYDILSEEVHLYGRRFNHAPRMGAMLMTKYDFFYIVFLVTICVIAIKA